MKKESGVINMSILAWGENKIRKFNVVDIIAFKVYLFSLGMIFGAYLSSFVIDYVGIFATIAILSLLWLLKAMFKS